MISHLIVTTYKTPNGTETVKTEEVLAEQEVTLEVEVPAGAVNKEIDVGMTAALIKSLLIAANRTAKETGTFASVIVKTNSTSAPDDTLTVKPSNAVCWSTGDPTICPITADVTKLYVSNAGTAKCDFVVRALQDPTP